MENSFFGRLKSNSVAKNTAWILGGNGLKLIIQSAYFIMIARSLEPTTYGAFVAVVAMAAILAPFVGLGTSNLIVRNVMRDPATFARSWGNGLAVNLFTGLIAFLLVISCRFLLPSNLHWSVLVLVAISDLLFIRLVDFCGFAFAAVNKFRANAQLNVWSSLSRLIGLVVLLLLIKHPDVDQWARTYLIASALTAVGAVIWGFASLGRPSFAIREMLPDLSEGFFFSVGQSAQNVYNDIDKTMLAKLGSLSATGIYGAAYRLIEVSLVPIRSMLSAAYPGFFRAGQNGMRSSLAYMGRLLPKAFGYSVFIMFGLFIFAPVVPHILGKDYARAVEALRWLAVLPPLKAVHSFLADALTGAGHQRLRTLIQVFVAGVNILINLWIIPAASWRGAAWSSIAADAMLMLLLALAVTTISRRERNLQPVFEEALL